ncbi:Protein of unknown function [Pyronema omphalodes CBS 100304]|uniref:Uncharacterized protein n=1 Tax=Pyronema omphalodes (strain CBS 100304) TaxID=1076935 RepID=U4L361_PYROM|nr:Protein of unknown function [Pyronema omphalodes CBS 100304]
MEDPKIFNHEPYNPMAEKRKRCEEEEEHEGNENKKLKEGDDNKKDEDEEGEQVVKDEDRDEEEEDGEDEEGEEDEESDEENSSILNRDAAAMVNFHHRPTRFYEVLYNRTRDIEETNVDYPEKHYYENLPDCETEEELHRAIFMREFTMHRVDHDVQVTNRYTQWLSTRVEDGELVQNTLEDDIWEIPNWISDPTGSEDED